MAFNKPTDPSASDYQDNLDLFNQQIKNVRDLASPDIASPITAEQLPEDVIVSDVYLGTARRKVFSDLGITSISMSDANYEVVCYMIAIRLAIELIPQLPQITRDGQLQDVTQYQSIDMQKRLDLLEAKYTTHQVDLNPSSDVTPKGAWSVVAGTI